MFDLVQLTEEQFLRPATLKAIKHEVFDLLEYLMAPEGARLANQIEQKLAIPGLELRTPEIYQQYKKLTVYLKLMSLVCQDDDTVLDLVQNHYLNSFEIGIDINERMTGKMYTKPVLVWLEHTEQLIHALKQNIQRIGERPIIILGETTPSAPTIQNWISDYDRTLGPDQHNDIEREEYLAKNPNAKLLVQAEKSKLRNVLEFYDNLKPIPLSIINAALKQSGILDELEKEFQLTGEEMQTPLEQPPFGPTMGPPTPMSPTKKYIRPEKIASDQYLEPFEEPRPALPTQPAPFYPPQEPPRIVNLRDQQQYPPTPPRPAPPQPLVPQQPKPTPPPAYQPQPPQQPPQPDQQHSQFIKDYYQQLSQAQTPQQPIQPPPAQKDSYLEPAKEALPSQPAQPQQPQRPEPKISGNIVDLKSADRQ